MAGGHQASSIASPLGVLDAFIGEPWLTNSTGMDVSFIPATCPEWTADRQVDGHYPLTSIRGRAILRAEVVRSYCARWRSLALVEPANTLRLSPVCSFGLGDRSRGDEGE